jgi:hypothetical protein
MQPCSSSVERATSLESSDGSAAVDHIPVDFAEFFADIFKLLQNLLLLFAFPDPHQLVKVAHLSSGPALDLWPSALDVSDQLQVLLQHFTLITEDVLGLELGI